MAVEPAPDVLGQGDSMRLGAAKSEAGRAFQFVQMQLLRATPLVQPFINAGGEAEAERQAVAFAKQILPILDPYIPI
jgi:hypothetical protein